MAAFIGSSENDGAELPQTQTAPNVGVFGAILNFLEVLSNLSGRNQSGGVISQVLQISLILLSLSAISGFLTPNFSTQPN
jgi:hypothetical protein